MAFSHILPALRRVAPTLTRRFFDCSHCSHTSFQRAIARKHFVSSAKRGGDVTLLRTNVLSPSTYLGRPVKDAQSRGRFFPETSEKVVAYWLLGSAASVFGIVVFGGLTRLTESGYGKLLEIFCRYTDLVKSKHNRMEAGNGLLAAYECHRLGLGIRKVSLFARIQTPQPTHDTR